MNDHAHLTIVFLIVAEFPKITMYVRMKCIKKFEDNNEIELTPVGDNTFYSKKIYKRS
jgi:hypothetical protein